MVPEDEIGFSSYIQSLLDKGDGSARSNLVGRGLYDTSDVWSGHG
jgi:hypothetical protein